MIDVSLHTFIATGAWGPVHLGMSRQEVESYFGDPGLDQEFLIQHPSPTTWPTVWAYGDIEFHFGPTGEDELFLIHMELDGRPLWGGDHFRGDDYHFRIDPWIIRPGLSFIECQALFNSQNVVFRSSVLAPGFGSVIRVGEQVEVRFDERDEDPGPLILFSLSSSSLGWHYPGEKYD